MKKLLPVSFLLFMMAVACRRPIMVVLPQDCVYAAIPTSFSPNSDGTNDVWYPAISPYRPDNPNLGVPLGSMPYDTACYEHCISHYTLEIYDNKNKLMFETWTYYQGWNGTRKGKRCQAGSYKYKLWWYDAEGKKTLLEGRIELML